jgi:hypothetical protein
MCWRQRRKSGMTKTKTEVKIGDYAYHSVYGVGIVIYVSLYKTLIKYKGGAETSLPTSLVEIISEEDAVMYKLRGR